MDHDPPRSTCSICFSTQGDIIAETFPENQKVTAFARYTELFTSAKAASLCRSGDGSYVVCHRASSLNAFVL